MASSSGSTQFSRWAALSDEQLTQALIDELLVPIQDDLWVCAACADRVLDDIGPQCALLDLGIKRTETAVYKMKESLDNPEDNNGSEDESGSPRLAPLSEEDRLVTYFGSHKDLARLCQSRAILLKRLDRLKTYIEIQEAMIAYDDGPDVQAEPEETWDDDPWAETKDEGVAEQKPKSSRSRPPPPLPLSVFLTQHPYLMSLALASQMQFASVKAIMVRHWPEIFPFRFEILGRIPLFADPSDFHELLPAINTKTGKEAEPSFTPWRVVPDWTELDNVKTALAQVGWPTDEPISEDDTVGLLLRKELLDGDEIASWYKELVQRIVSSTGTVDVALSLVQHGVSQGLLGLDELGEDLTLISRLVYDAPKPLHANDDQTISIPEWQSLEPQAVIRRYLAYSTPDTIVSDIRRLIMPYLFVLESRFERAGKPDPGLVKRHLYDCVLDANLNMVVPIFEASKPTLVASQRLIADDEDLARLALACLYGSSSLNEWTSMSRIFECLPAWNFGADEDEEDEADTTVASLSAFLAPTTARPHCSPSDLLMFFKPLPARSLSRALDILDVHLESGEILARWGVPVPLRWFLQTAHDEVQQRAWATKMARQADAPPGDLDSEDIWLSLLDDMLKLSKPTGADTNSAFGALPNSDITRIFLKGLLSTGRFSIAKHIIQTRAHELLLDGGELEAICLDCSREFYDNASSGNYNFGDMKLAYDCLSVALQSPAIQKEREFIEATSRICSFNVMSRPGVPITPLEIRLTKDRLSLISRVLSSNETAYKHTEVILELMRKLGYHNDILAEVKTLAMIAETALQAEDFERAFDISERMVNIVLRLRQASPFGTDSPQVAEAVEVCWVACFQLGRQPEAEGIDKKMALLGRALELCPPDKIADVLAAWRKLEAEDIERRSEKTAERDSRNKKFAKKGSTTRGRAATLASRLQNLHVPSPSLPSAPDAAALASHAFSRVAASFPFSMHGRKAEESRSRSRDGSERRAGSPDVQSQARHALQRGLGWLIGADDDEL